MALVGYTPHIPHEMIASVSSTQTVFFMVGAGRSLPDICNCQRSGRHCRMSAPGRFEKVALDSRSLIKCQSESLLSYNVIPLYAGGSRSPFARSTTWVFTLRAMGAFAALLRLVRTRAARPQRREARGQAARHRGHAAIVERRRDIVRGVVVRIAQVSGVRHHDGRIA